MKKLLTLTSMIAVFFTASSQTLDWAKQIKKVSVRESKTNSNGDLIIIGNFLGTVDFDPGIATVNLTSQGSEEDIFIAQYLKTGALSWAKRIGNSELETFGSLAIDPNNNILITLNIKGVVDVDPSTATVNVGGAGKTNAFFAKYNNMGNFMWVKSFDKNIKFTNIACTNLDQIIVAGYYEGTADFNPSPAATANLTTSNPNTLFVASYNSTGTYNWVKSYGKGNAYTSDLGSIGLFIDENKNIFVTGYFTGTVDFNPSPTVTNNLSTPTSVTSTFFTKLKADGSFVFAKAIIASGTSFTYIISDAGIVVDKNGNIFLAGTFNQSADFDPSNGVKTLTATTGVNNTDIFVAKYSSIGDYKWAKKIGNKENEKILSMQLTKNDNVLLYGKFKGTVDFNPNAETYNLTSSNYTSSSSSFDDIFVASLKNSGDFNFAYAIGTSWWETAYTLSVGKTLNNFYITGIFKGTVDFNPTASTTNLTSSTEALFITKYTLPTTGIMPNENDSQNRIFEETNSQISNLNTHISLYPNPANDFISIEYKNFENTNTNNIKIYDITGKEVSNYSVTNNNNTSSQLNISNFESGIYIITIQTQDKIIREKFIKQ